MRCILVAGLSFVLTACGSAPNYSGTWQPLNVYSKFVEEIPLARPYQYYALPIDGTLKGLLERWASDSDVQLHYLYSSDFSLPVEVKGIDQLEFSKALLELKDIYLPYGVSINFVKSGRGNNVLSVSISKVLSEQKQQQRRVRKI